MAPAAFDQTSEAPGVPLQQALRHRHQAFTAFFAVEDLHVCGMVRNRRLAQAISDCGVSSAGSLPANATGTAAA